MGNAKVTIYFQLIASKCRISNNRLQNTKKCGFDKFAKRAAFQRMDIPFSQAYKVLVGKNRTRSYH